MPLTAPLRDAVADRRRVVDAVVVTTLLVATLELVVPAVLLAGYLVRLLDGDAGLPSTDDAVSLLGTGVRAATVATLASLPVAAAWLIATQAAPPGGVEMLLADLAAGRLPPWPWLLGSVVTVASFVAATFLAPASAYVAVVLVTRYASGDFVGALAVAPLWGALTDGRNLRAAVVALSTLVAAGVGAALVGVLPLGPVSRFVHATVTAVGALAAAVLWRAHAPAAKGPSTGDDEDRRAVASAVGDDTAVDALG